MYITSQNAFINVVLMILEMILLQMCLFLLMLIQLAPSFLLRVKSVTVDHLHVF
jgi:hypothetical protein